MSIAHKEKAVVVAIDHGQHFGVFDAFEDPEKTLETILEADVDGVLAGVPFLRRFESLLDSYPSVDRIATLDLIHESTFPGESDGAEIHRQTFSVSEAARIGADGIKFALVYGREDPDVLGNNLQFIAKAAEEARSHDLDVIVEPTLWGKLAEDELHSGRLTNANRVGFEIGADVLKSPYPGTPEGFEPIVENAPVPVYIAGGPATESDMEALAMVKDAIEVGARGIMIGRNIWQREDVAGMIEAMKAIIHDDAEVEEAKRHLQ